MALVKKGQWYSYCCEEDLYQATEDFEEDEENCGMTFIGVWDSHEEALSEIVRKEAEYTAEANLKLQSMFPADLKVDGFFDQFEEPKCPTN